MNAGAVESHTPAPVPPASGWRWKKIILVTLFAFAAHLAFVFLLGAKKTAVPLTATNAPLFHLADNASDLIRFTDPTWFALPHAGDFAPAAGAQAAAAGPSSFAWTEPPMFLALNSADLGAAFHAFMQTNRFAGSPLNFKPQPQLPASLGTVESQLPKISTWRLAGEIAGRQVLNARNFSVPTLAVNDVIAPSRVQLLVGTDGRVISAILLASEDPLVAGSDYEPAGQQALALARALRFAPADKLMFGEIIFTWHTAPAGQP